FALLIALIAVSAMASSMKSVYHANAGAYEADGGLRLTRKNDIYLNTTRQVRWIKKESN
ncbi:MAG: hypothetical protein HUJ58_01160, partial [Erysipelotrichaceae bacterium]|nr:hypothetical protein [Erysipelotrichaceae bacterium]